MTSKLVVNTIESAPGISSVSFASSISMSSTSKFFFGAAGIDIGADTNINRPATGVLGFNINGSEKVRIKSNGYVGIGTDNPSQPLTLARSSTGQSEFGLRFQYENQTGPTQTSCAILVGSYGLKLKNYNSSRNFLFETGNVLVGTTTDSNNKVTLYGNNASVVMQNAATGTGASQGFYIGNGNGTLSYVWNYEDDAIQFATNNTERLRITNNGQLNTYTTGTVTATFNTSNGAGSYLHFNTGVSGTNIGYIGAGSQLVTGSQTNDLGFRSANHMVFSTGGSVERLRINSNGEIYCTTSSTIVLDLNTTSSSGAYLQLDIGVSGANIGYMGAGSQLVTGSSTNDLGLRSVENLVFSTGGAVERLRVDTSGNVLVGGTSLGAAGSFGIEPNGHVRSVHAANSTGDTLFGAISGISNGFQINLSGSNDQLYRFHNGSQISMQIDSSGRVTKPLTPSFQAYGVSGTQSQVLTFSNVYHNIGNHFNAGTGYFTCPVAGRYLFTFAFLHNTNPTSYARVLFQLNGSRSTQYGDTLCDDTGLYLNTSMSMIFNLSANDTVALYNEGNNIYSSQYGAFSGILLA